MYTINWTFSLDINNGWTDKLDKINITNPELIKVTKNVTKLNQYILYITKYKKTLKKAISFSHKNNLNQPLTINHLDKPFISGLFRLYNDLLDMSEIHKQFIESLNWFEEKRYNEFKSTLTNNNININIKLSSKTVSL